ncbi:hypothetical protein Kisp01_50280 [Kineosporia sp. NBRC 101677]|nr:hypothetical protein Kisp01_50280 [Kineosporia sp. NBRC 101677]
MPDEVEWLTPTPDGTPVVLRWPDENGPFLLTCHLAQVDGRSTLVGLDIRSFIEGPEGLEPGPLGLSEVNHPMLRSLRAGEIAEAARLHLAAELAAQARSRKLGAEGREQAKHRFDQLTAPQRARAGGARPASSQLERVAAIYNEIVAAGGDGARRPSIYVHQALVNEGQDVSLNTVRGQLHRAKAKGLLNGK